ncbi:trichohyalin-like [Papaver somniferum]|uniref:trichohyalin-like n=1 Tax=Papaver somniferum TaxID=3469 RepID=UPI000E6F932E|nr:trichohyalin-like [Papaver somniferum]
MTREELEENIGEEDITLDQMRETLLLEMERDRNLAEQHARLTRENARLMLQNRQLNEEAAADSTDSEVNMISSREEELRRRRYTHKGDRGERRRKRRRENSEVIRLRRSLEISSWGDQRRRYEEEQNHEENERRREDERQLKFNQKDEEERRRGEVLDELRDMRTLIKNSRRGSRVHLEEAIEEADKSPFTYEIMYVDIPEKCVLPTLPSIFSGSESVVQHLKQYTFSLMQ